MMDLRRLRLISKKTLYSSTQGYNAKISRWTKLILQASPFAITVSITHCVTRTLSLVFRTGVSHILAYRLVFYIPKNGATFLELSANRYVSSG
jgi:hypothetical protein